jgi:SpoVK/Ycf46/Vps4 family AAA+-type ATPase
VSSFSEMESVFSDFETILEQACGHIECAISNVENGDAAEGKECAAQAATLLSALSQFHILQNFEILRTIQICKNALEASIVQLRCTQDTENHATKVLPHHVTEVDASLDEKYELGEGDSSRSADLTLMSVIGADTAKRSLIENVVLPLLVNDEESRRLFSGIRCGAGNVLLYGPPGSRLALVYLLTQQHEVGCGKTQLAHATANEAGAVLFAVRPSDIQSKYQGESEKYISQLFEKARKQTRSIIFFDGKL